MKNKINNSWYSIIVVLLIIWFLLVLSTGIFNLILKELKDNKSMWNYIKAYAWAESSQELALLQIKENGYAYYDKVDHDINDSRSIVLADNSLDKSFFNKNIDTLISYDIWSRSQDYNWTLSTLWYDIIPLFYINDSWEQKVTDISLSFISWNLSDLSWNIVWKTWGISWTWITNIWHKKIYSSVDKKFTYSTESINSFISWSDINYLVLLNWWNANEIKYNLKSNNMIEYFTTPKSYIISSAEVWKYKQNLSTYLDNTEFLNMIKYSIYSN